ncbi:MAG: tetratricopeptide repeat protein [Pyrinomonadaceae bacterium]|nr:tetratricopeptide repeat protein [Pyrinomonadaceae bacterium]
MAFDKAKTLRAAEKHLSKGNITAAVQEYRQIAEQDPGDFNALNTLGDLYARTDRKQEAEACFKRVGGHFREQGFIVKAIAIYKKVARITPGDIDVAGALAALYEQQGLLVEARAQHLIIAEAHTRAGRTREMFEALQRIADLDPNNTEIRLRLADGLTREGMHDLAAAAFTEAGAHLLARGNHPSAIEVFNKVLAVRPASHPALHGIVTAHAALGTAGEAAKVIKQAVIDQPQDLELRAMLSRAYVEAGDAASAERATDELVSQDSSNYALFFDVARLYIRLGEVDGAVRILGRVIEPALAGREEGEMQELLQQALAHDTQHLAALRLLARLYAWQRRDDELRPTLERIAESARSSGQIDEERNALAQLVRLAPAEARFADRLNELGGTSENGGAAASDYEVAPQATSEVPTFESFMVDDDAYALTPNAAAPVADDAGAKIEWNTVDASPAATADADASFSFADLNDFSNAVPGHNPAATAGTTSDAVSGDFQEIDFGAPASGSTAPAEGDEHQAAMLKQELESIDFYITQGYHDIARDTLDVLERQYGTHPDIDARRRQLPDGGEGASATDSIFAAPVSAEAVVSTEAVEGGTEFGDFGDFADYGAAAEADAIDAGTSDEVDGAFDGLMIDAPLSPPPPSVAAVSQASLDLGLAAIFDEFRSAVEEEEEPKDTEDFETHYNLGLAYKDMDLLDKAIEEFQAAAGLTAPSDGTPRYLQCCNMLGHCFMQKGMGPLAAMWLKKGISAPGHTEDEYQALRYELGIAYEQMGDLTRALETFTEVYGTDVSYRGVADKLRELQAQKTIAGER